MKKISQVLNRITEFVGKILSITCIILIFTIVLDVFARYIFNYSTPASNELEWHLFSLIILLSLSYTLLVNNHIVVDIFHLKFSKRVVKIIDVFSFFVFLLPFTLMMLYTSIPYVVHSYSLGEGTPDPGGLPYRWIVKSFIPIGFALFLCQGISNVIQTFIDEKPTPSKHI